ncbi:nucleotidyltransferase domain-containing protein [Candidatus Pacearchaeota archaeon]|nr:nucleotidyltransferase domain-containing protein [Candidatus Pacearchaeota archaeon]
MEKQTTPKNLNEQINNPKYIPAGGMPEISEHEKKEIDKQKKELDKLKDNITKKYPFTIAIGILPQQYVPKIEQEENIPESEKNEKRIHIVHIIPEEQFKNIPKIKKELLELTKEMKPKAWFHIITPVDIWNFLMDSRYDLSSAVAMAFPLYDKGLLGALRVAEVHKSLVLRKFEKYVSSYVIAGSLVRGTATKTSDIDVFVIIDDTDVKRMPRLELRERLRSIIYQYIPEASAIAGVKNKLEPQIYLLTDFWEAVKDAHPVMFTFIRDGVALYDKGTFTPWKLLLKMGKIKPSPEAIDMFMSMGDKTADTVNRRLIDAMIDIYYGVLTPSQALLMLYGLAPPTHKETPTVFKEIFHDKEKLIEAKYVKTLERAVRLFKDYEHGKLKKMKGEEIDTLLKEMEDYIKRMKQLREQIEKAVQKKTIEQIEHEVFEILANLLGKKSRKELISTFDKELVKKGKMPQKMLSIIKDIETAVADMKKGKTKNAESVRKDSVILMNHLIDYGQRCDLVAIDKSRMQIIYKNNRAELIFTEQEAFLIEGQSIKKITDKVENSNPEALNKAIASQKGKLQIKFSPKIFELIRKELGDFEIVI